MHTKATIAGHPIHPMLVGFPDHALRRARWPRSSRMSARRSVLVRRRRGRYARRRRDGALAMAIPGLIDLVSLPARSRARGARAPARGPQRGHALMFLVIAAMLRRARSSAAGRSAGYVLDCDGAARVRSGRAASIALAGVLGWKLVQTHHVGITRPCSARSTSDEVDDLDELPVTAYPSVEPGRRVQCHH